MAAQGAKCAALEHCKLLGNTDDGTPEIAISINGWEITDIGAVVDEN